ncbi:Armadillo-like helical domain containing protein [Gracilaria domingensis]|nr:Armadillo-like helical domain containing protein [Gracilaria domingensis]
MRRPKRDICIGDHRMNTLQPPTTDQDVTVLDESHRMPDRPRGVSTRTRTASPASPSHNSESPGGLTDLFNEEVEFFDEAHDVQTAGSSPGVFSLSRRVAREFEPKSQPSSPNWSTAGFPRHRSEPAVAGNQIADISSLLELANTPSALVDRARETRRHGTQEGVRDRAKEFAKELEGCKSPSTAYSILKGMMEFAFGLVEFTALLERQQALDDYGAFRRMVEIQNSYLEHAGIQKLSCTILGSLRLDESIGGLKLGMMQTVDTIVQCLREHGRVASICREGVRALTALSKMNDVRTRVIPTCNAIGVTVSCMELHAGDEYVQNEGARFFSHASLHSETNKSHIAMHGGLRRALRAAREFPASRALHTHLCTTIRNITLSRPDVVAQAEVLDSVEALMDTLKRHGQASTTAMHALAALHHLTTSHESVRRIVRYDSWEHILIGTARRHSSKPTVQALTMAVAGSVVDAGAELTHERLVQAGAVKTALVAMHRFVNRRAVLLTGSHLVKILLLECEEGMSDLRQCGGIGRLLDLLYCTVVTPTSGEERYSGYSDSLDNS